MSLPEGRQDADCNDADTSSPSVASQIGDTFTPILREPEVKKKTHIPSHLTHRYHHELLIYCLDGGRRKFTSYS